MRNLICRKLILSFLITSSLAGLILTGCSAYKPFNPPPPVPDDRNACPCPEYRDTFNDFTDFIDKQFTIQGEQFVDIPRHVHYISGCPREAYNADAFGEIPNSSWFTNRNAVSRMSIDEIVKGPCTTTGPDTSGDWTIIRAKMEGVTSGFTIVDPHGDKYVIKFDPPGYAGLNSGSEVIGSRLFFASGFNVPENHVCFFNPDVLKLGEKVKLTDEKGRKRLMNDDDLEEIISGLQYEENGLIRATASKYVPGRILGPFKYHDVREDDPNDFIPHEHRRELRGLRVIGAWLKHIDAKGANSMDTYIEEDGVGCVKHYLIDFGTILGSGGRGPQPIYRGHENEMDPHAFFLRILTLGLYSPAWERVPQEVDKPCIGRYYSEYFHPYKFKPIFPNPAYDNLTDADGYWGAKIVMSFTDEQLAAVVAEAKYPDPVAAECLLKTLIRRRDITGKYWFDRIAPLDNFELITGDNGKMYLNFHDLAVETGLEESEKSGYRFRIRLNGDEVVGLTETKDKSISLPEASAECQLEVAIQVRRGEEKWSDPVRMYLNAKEDAVSYALVGIRR